MRLSWGDNENKMVVKTNFSKEDISKILSKYSLGRLVSFESTDKGTVQTNIFIKTTKARFVLRYYENRSKKSVLFEINLINYLKNKKYPCPTPFKNNRGKIVGIFKNKPYVLFEFVEGKHIEKPTEKQKKQLIQKVAELQNLTGNYRPLYEKYRINYNIKFCKKLAKEEVKRLRTANAIKKAKWIKSELMKLELPKSLPKGVCHCDFHFSNVLFKENKFKALIDFDDANYTYRVYDLICLISPFVSSFDWNTWEKFKLTENVFDFRETKKIILEYMKHAFLSDVEKYYLFDIYKLSILIDCIWYFERGNAEDFFEKRKIDHLNNLGREEFYKRIFGGDIKS